MSEKRTSWNRVILTGDQESWLVENYPTMRNGDICRHLGITLRVLGLRAHEMGLKKIDNFYELHKEDIGRKISRDKRLHPEKHRFFEHGNMYGKRYSKESPCSDEDQKKALAARKKTIYEERVRIKYGIPQRTKLKLKKKFCITTNNG